MHELGQANSLKRWKKDYNSNDRALYDSTIIESDQENIMDFEIY